MSDVKNQAILTVAANTSTSLTTDTATNGWLDIVHMHYDASATGAVGIQIKRSGTDWMVVGATDVAAETDAIWTGNTYLNAGDIVRINNITAVAATVYITIGYELAGAGTWQTFDVGVGDESSSSSDSSSSESSSDSSQSSSSDSSDSSTSVSSPSSSLNSSSSPSSSLNSSSSPSSSLNSSSSSDSSESSASTSSASTNNSSSSESSSSESSSSG